MGLGRVELPTSPLSGVRSNQLSYRPKNKSKVQSVKLKGIIFFTFHFYLFTFDWRMPVGPSTLCIDQEICCGRSMSHADSLLGKEVIQPQVPLRLPCYDFTPVTNHTVVGAPPAEAGLSNLLLVQPAPMV